MKDPHEGGALEEQAGLDPVGVGRPEAAEGALGEAQPEHPRDRQAREQDPVIPATPPDAGDGEFQQQRSEEADAIGPTDPALR